MKTYNSFGYFMLSFLRFGTLFIGTLLLVSASLGCSFWFFYSFLDASTPSQLTIALLGFDLPLLPVVAGCVGCGAQLFVYSFAANLSHIADFFFKAILVLISTLTIGLSMFSTYSTLISFLENKSQTIAHKEFVMEQRQHLIQSRTSDMGTNSLSAEQAITDKYRTQSKGLTETNEALRAQQLEELAALSDDTSNIASPLDGLVRVVGNDSLVAALFCGWLAVTFDLLPILGISLLGRLATERINVKVDKALSHGVTKAQELEENRDTEDRLDKLGSSNGEGEGAQLPIHENSDKYLAKGQLAAERVEEDKSTKNIKGQVPISGRRSVSKANNDPSMDENTLEETVQTCDQTIRDIIDKKPLYSELPDHYQQTAIADIPSEVIYPIVTKYLCDRTIPISYAGVMGLGLSKWKTQQYFTKAVNEGFILKKNPENIEAGYEFTKTTRYHIKRGTDLKAILYECQNW